MILLHTADKAEVAMRADDILVAVRRSGPSAFTEVSVRTTPTEFVSYTVTETPAVIVAMVNSAGGPR